MVREEKRYIDSIGLSYVDGYRLCALGLVRVLRCGRTSRR